MTQDIRVLGISALVGDVEDLTVLLSSDLHLSLIR